MPSPVGPLRLVCDGEGFLKRIDFGEGAPADAGSVAARALAEVRGQLEAYFDGTLTRFNVPLAPEGTDFQRRVWALVSEIPYGETRSYGALATLLGGGSVARAVGRANATNPIPIIVPCHRVVGAAGTLVGYAGGLETKEWLLLLEGVLPAGQPSLFG